MLDSIFDPQNLGAIIRAAECFGADLVIFSKNRGADITPVATKTSAGATELVPIIKVSNLVETMKTFQKAELWVYCLQIQNLFGQTILIPRQSYALIHADSYIDLKTM